MVLRQTNASFQNDGNFSSLDLTDSRMEDRTMRLESLRASHPEKRSATLSAAGSSAYALCGADHCKPGSDQIFRHIFSVQDKKKKVMEVKLELREKYLEDGSWEVKIRDLQHGSLSYGSVLVCSVIPMKGRLEGKYALTYELYHPETEMSYMFTSPLDRLISSVSSTLPDLSEGNGRQGILQMHQVVYIDINTPLETIREFMEPVVTVLKEKKYHHFVQHVQLFMRFSSFQGRCLHAGEFLKGDFIQESAGVLRFFQSAACSILFGKLFQLLEGGNTASGYSLWHEEAPLSKPINEGIHHFLILAHVLNVEHYQLVLDKLYSDYSEIPMKMERGSQLENGISAKKSAYRANQTLARIALVFYESQFKL